jgi:EAL domain-containing protein (putative c-di-GMP-specific phosphodiesterase class I)/PleD family two-component response regulator
MILHDESSLAERQPVRLHLRLPERIGTMLGRLRRFERSGWDINGLALTRDDARRWADSCRQEGLEPTASDLHELAASLDDSLASENLPDADTGARLLALAERILAELPEPPSESIEPPQDVLAPAHMMSLREAVMQMSADEPSGQVQQDEWTDFTESWVEPEPEGDAVAEASEPWGDNIHHFGPTPPIAPLPVVETPPPRPRVEPAAPAPRMASAPAMATRTSSGNADAVQLTVPAGFRLYHLTAHGPLSVELDQRLEAQGLEIELLEDVEELKELLGALPADLILIDADFSTQLEGLGESVQLARQRFGKRRLLVVAISEADDITLRLSARRGGVDALVVAPQNASDILKRLQALLDPERQESYRVLIVEDDRSQALFAEGILRNAGMESMVVLDALDVMPALEQFHPDMILMDLNMPGANGIELTALIREREDFAHTPIVFLSGESSEDLQFDAIDAGGDDFLSKPIRPRHLISAVQSRVRRHRSLAKRQNKRPDRDPATGLVYRNALIDLISDNLQSGQDKGGLLFVEIDGLGLLRERIGLAALEQLLGDVSRALTGLLGNQQVTRIGDGSYLVLDTDRDESRLESLASMIRNSLVEKAFQALGQPVRLRVSVGVCAFAHGFASANVMLNSAEKVAREARASDRGIRRFEPPKAVDTQRASAAATMVIEALQQRRMEVVYQPVVAVAGSDVAQYQLLLRLRDREGKLHNAAEVVPAAEKAGLIVEIDRWVVGQALAQIRVHRDQHRMLRLFVTQSALTIATPGQAEWLRTELMVNEIPGSALAIEVRLEDAALNAAEVGRFCSEMVADGVPFSLGQFQAGTDAESLLNQLPLSFIKLARKYTMGAPTQAVRDELKTVIELAHRRGLEVIGHAVEDAQSAATLWMSGIDFIQGNLVQEANTEINFDFNQAVL